LPISSDKKQNNAVVFFPYLNYLSPDYQSSNIIIFFTKYGIQGKK